MVKKLKTENTKDLFSLFLCLTCALIYFASDCLLIEAFYCLNNCHLTRWNRGIGSSQSRWGMMFQNGEFIRRNNYHNILYNKKNPRSSLVMRDDWEVVLTALKAYKRIKGNLNIPVKFVIPKEFHMPSKDETKSKCNNFVTSVTSSNLVKDSIDQVNVYRTKKEAEEQLSLNEGWPPECCGMRLGARALEIRTVGRYIDENQSRKIQLDELGFNWKVRRSTIRRFPMDSKSFHLTYKGILCYGDIKKQDAEKRANKQGEGNDLRWESALESNSKLFIPEDFLVPDYDSRWPPELIGFPLGYYASNLQNSVVLFNPDSAEKIHHLMSDPDINLQILEASSSRSLKFFQMYAALISYLKKYGLTSLAERPLPKDFTVPENDLNWNKLSWGLALSDIVNAVSSRMAYLGSGEERVARKKLLDDIGFPWQQNHLQQQLLQTRMNGERMLPHAALDSFQNEHTLMKNLQRETKKDESDLTANRKLAQSEIGGEGSIRKAAYHDSNAKHIDVSQIKWPSKNNPLEYPDDEGENDCIDEDENDNYNCDKHSGTISTEPYPNRVNSGLQHIYIDEQAYQKAEENQLRPTMFTMEDALNPKDIPKLITDKSTDYYTQYHDDSSSVGNLDAKLEEEFFEPDTWQKKYSRKAHPRESFLHWILNDEEEQEIIEDIETKTIFAFLLKKYQYFNREILDTNGTNVLSKDREKKEYENTFPPHVNDESVFDAINKFIYGLHIYIMQHGDSLIPKDFVVPSRKKASRQKIDNYRDKFIDRLPNANYEEENADFYVQNVHEIDLSILDKRKISLLELDEEILSSDYSNDNTDNAWPGSLSGYPLGKILREFLDELPSFQKEASWFSDNHYLQPEKSPLTANGEDLEAGIKEKISFDYEENEVNSMITRENVKVTLGKGRGMKNSSSSSINDEKKQLDLHGHSSLIKILDWLLQEIWLLEDKSKFEAASDQDGRQSDKLLRSDINKRIEEVGEKTGKLETLQRIFQRGPGSEKQDMEFEDTCESEKNLSSARLGGKCRNGRKSKLNVSFDLRNHKFPTLDTIPKNTKSEEI